MTDMGIHWLDTVRQISGLTSPKSVAATGGCFELRKDRADSFSICCSWVKAKSMAYRLLGNPRTRSATMLRRISDVPASIVFPLLRS